MKTALNHNVAIPRIPSFFCLPPSMVLEDAAAHIHPAVADIPPAEADTRPAAVGAAHILAGAVDRSLVAEGSRQVAVQILAESGQVGRIGLEVVDHIGLVVADRIALEEAGRIGLAEGHHIGREHRSLVEEGLSSHLCGRKMDRWLP